MSNNSLCSSQYFTENHATKDGAKLIVNLPEKGLNNVEMQIVSIKPVNDIKLKESGAEVYK